MSKILDGRKVADKIISSLSDEIEDLKAKNIKPVLCVILIGDNPASKIYVTQKKKRIEGLGLGFNLYEFLHIATNEQVIELIEKLNRAEHVDGILIQLPFPYSFKKEKILEKINPKKDIDSLTKNSKYKSPTAQAIWEILRFYKISVKNKKVVVIGKGDLVGKPFGKLAKDLGAKITVCNKKTKDINQYSKKADILVSGTGQAGLIKSNMVSNKTVIIDAGTSSDSGSQKGDVDFKNVCRKVKAITPPTGGVGPVTIACLIRNLIKAVKFRKSS